MGKTRRCNTETTIANNYGCDPMPRRDGQRRIPEQLSIIMGMNVDKPRTNHPSMGLYRVLCFTGHLTQSSNFAILNPNVALTASIPTSINDGPPEDF